MLQQIQQAALEGTITITHAYLGHIKKDDERKILAHADAFLWEDLEPTVRRILEKHLHQAIDGEIGEQLFPTHCTGEILSVAKVASEEYDRSRNQSAVEVLEGIRDMSEAMGDRFNDQLIEFGNNLAYKVMAAGAIKNHLVAILKLGITSQLGAEPIHFTFATIVNLDDREESVFDERTGKFVTQAIHNAIKRSRISVGVLFPCLDDHGRESADMLVYAGAGAGGWFRALEVNRRFSPQQEGKALLRMIAEQTAGTEVPSDLLARLSNRLANRMVDLTSGIPVPAFATALEKSLGHGIDRMGLIAHWESAFGDLEYRPALRSLFTNQLKLRAGGIEVAIRPDLLDHFGQVTNGGRTFILFEVPETAKVVVGSDLDMWIRGMAWEGLMNWLDPPA